MYFERLYDAYVILGHPTAPPVWHAEAWSAVAEALDPFTKSPRGPATLRCNQIDAPRRQHIPFGRLSWKPSSFFKWTHGPHQPLADSQPWLFESLEAWAPSWSVSAREGIPPDFFLGVHNEAMGQGHHRSLQFNPTIVCALGISSGLSELASFRAAVLGVATSLSSPLSAYLRRPWGLPFAGAYSDAIQDLFVTRLFRPGQPHTRPLTLATFSEPWQELPRGTAA